MTRLLSRSDMRAFLTGRITGKFPANAGDYVVHDGNAKLVGLRLDHGESEWERAHASASKNIAGLIVDGDLDVDGNILNGEQDFGPTLVVLGSLRARNVGLGGAAVYVAGDLVAAECVHAYYNHGYLRVRGDVRARVVVASEYFGAIDGTIAAPCYGRHHLEIGRPPFEVPPDKRTVFVPEVLTREDFGDDETDDDDEPADDDETELVIDDGELFERLENGEPVVIGGVATSPCPLRST
jgi:hypothetical protein